MQQSVINKANWWTTLQIKIIQMKIKTTLNKNMKFIFWKWKKYMK
jgi:hypothetical protein